MILPEMYQHASFSIYCYSMWERRRVFLKIVVVKAPKFLRGILCTIFGVR